MFKFLTKRLELKISFDPSQFNQMEKLMSDLSTILDKAADAIIAAKAPVDVDAIVAKVSADLQPKIDAAQQTLQAEIDAIVASEKSNEDKTADIAASITSFSNKIVGTPPAPAPAPAAPATTA